MMKAMTLTAAGIAGALLTTLIVGPSANAQSNQQKTKNNLRNVGTVAGVLAGQQALKGKGTNALILGAGAAYAGKKYEDTRKEQNNSSNDNRHRYGYRSGYRSDHPHHR